MNKYHTDITEGIASLSQSLYFLKGLSHIEFALLTASVLFFSTTLVLNSYMLLRRNYINYRQTRVKALIEKYETLLIEYIYAPKNEKEVLFSTIKPLNKLESSILLAQIILMKKNITGNEAFVLMDLYKKLGYYKVSFKKLHSFSWVKRYEGMQELAYMQVMKLKPIVFKLIKGKNPIVRIATIKALILNNMYWETMLQTYKYPLSQWEQVQICEALYTTKSISFKQCLSLLESKNQTVVALVGMCEKLFTQLNPHELSSIKDEALSFSLSE